VTNLRREESHLHDIVKSLVVLQFKFVVVGHQTGKTPAKPSQNAVSSLCLNPLTNLCAYTRTHKKTCRRSL